MLPVLWHRKNISQSWQRLSSGSLERALLRFDHYQIHKCADGIVHSHNRCYTNGQSQFNKTYNIWAQWNASGEGGDQRRNVSGSLLIHFNPYTGSIWADTSRLTRWDVQYYTPYGQGVAEPNNFSASAGLQ